MASRRLVLAPKAQSDLLDIRRYTDEKWGAARRGQYMARIIDRCQELLDQPNLGQARDEVRAGLRSLPTGEHVIWYRAEPDRIAVVRVLHGAMDYQSRLS